MVKISSEQEARKLKANEGFGVFAGETTVLLKTFDPETMEVLHVTYLDPAAAEALARGLFAAESDVRDALIWKQ